jgi:hypothetical protein
MHSGAAWAAVFAASLLGCATYSERTEAARNALQRGQYDASLEQFNKLLRVNDAAKLPDKWKKNDELIVLERATVLQAKGDFELSARDFQVADKRLEILDIARDGAGKLGKYIYSDSATKYKTSPTEKMALNAMNMCNYLVRGDLDGARVEAKRFTVMRNYLRDYDPEHEHGAFGSYLAGFVYERLGRGDEALRYYDEALQERDFSSLARPIPELAQRWSYRGERIEDYLPVDEPRSNPPAPQPPGDKRAPAQPDTSEPEAEPRAPEAVPRAPEAAPRVPEQSPAGQSERESKVSYEPQTWSGGDAAMRIALAAWMPKAAAAVAPEPARGAELLVIAKVGRVPYKEPRRIPIGAAIGIAGTFVTGDPRFLEYGLFKVVTYPELVRSGALFDRASLKVDGYDVELDLASDLASEIIREYDELRPKIIGAALTRMIARAAAAEGARAAGHQAKEGGAVIGLLAAFALEGTLVALDKPDTRSWTSLPSYVYVGRAHVPAGSHTVVVTARGPRAQERRRFEMTAPEGGFVVLDVTTLR